MTAKDYFKGKRIAVIGLGPHGEMANDIKFLIKSGALVSLYDLRSEARLKSDIALLRSVGLASYVCGSVPAEDLIDVELVILSNEYPRNSSFLAAANAANIPIEYSESLFFKLAPPVTMIGIMGECGKSTIMSMLAPMLEAGMDDAKQELFVIDSESNDGILMNLKKIKNGDVVLIRMTDLTMKEAYALRMSPHVAVFTSVPSRSMYTQSPFEILSYQTYNNFIVASDEVIDATHTYGFQPKAKMLRTKASVIPTDWDFVGRGIHDRENAALAIQVARLFKVPEDNIQEILESWKPLRGRLEFIKKVKLVEFYNDTASISADSTQASLQALSTTSSDSKNIILIMGGVDGGHDYRSLYTLIPKFVHTLIVIPGSGTLKERLSLHNLENVEVLSVPTIEDAVTKAFEKSAKGDRVLFSPGFGAGGLDQSRRERGDRFVKAVRALK